jgi:hypothetical protein
VAKRNTNNNVKVQSITVSSRSWFGPSEMDQKMQTYLSGGWELIDKEKLENNRYRLTFQHPLTESEIE